MIVTLNRKFSSPLILNSYRKALYSLFCCFQPTFGYSFNFLFIFIIQKFSFHDLCCYNRICINYTHFLLMSYNNSICFIGFQAQHKMCTSLVYATTRFCCQIKIFFILFYLSLTILPPLFICFFHFVLFRFISWICCI